MIYFKNFTTSDRATFEGRPVLHIVPEIDKKSKEITHYQLSIVQDAGEVELRKFCPDEIPHLIETEALVIEHGFYSPERQRDRALYGSKDLFGATAAQRESVGFSMFLNQLMERSHKEGMPLTRQGVAEYSGKMRTAYETYQARVKHGTKAANSKQNIKRLPHADTLLTNFRKYRKNGGNPNAFLAPLAVPINDDLHAGADFCFVMERLGAYASSQKPSKCKIIEALIDDIAKENSYRRLMGHAVLIKVQSKRTYERWITQYLDPFEVCMQREGLSSAIKKFGSVEEGRKAKVPGEIVVFDAWRMHIKVLDCTRAEWIQMTVEKREQVKLVSLWVTTAMDMATRCIVGISFSKAPCEAASLEALRTVFMDKTYLLRDIGIEKSKWNFFCPVQEIVNDNGSEFGKEPFGGAMFSRGARLLGSTHMNTPAGVSFLRGAMERFYWTSDQKWARYLPGYTAENPQARNDRKYISEVCITRDEVQELYIAFIAEYHKTPHRGLTFRTPAAVWEELTQDDEYDATALPSPGKLREACGFYAKAKVCEAGIRYAGAVYTNEFVRNQRKARIVDRLSAPGETVEIKVDPFDLGAISVVSNGELISVRCLDPNMAGKSLRQWQEEKQLQALKAQTEALEQKGARKEAADRWNNLAKSVMRTADVGIFGYTATEIKHAAMELDFGKGQHEKGFIGRDEYEDPVLSDGFATGTDQVFEDEDEQDADSSIDTPTSMDRFRSSSKNRARKIKGGK